MFDMLSRAPSQAVSCLVYERLLQDPKSQIERACAWWGVPFSERMLSSKYPEPIFTLSSECERVNEYQYEDESECEEDNSREGNPLDLFKSMAASSTIEPDMPCHRLASNAAMDNIEQHVGFLYAHHFWKDDILRLRAILTEKTWIGFDLDDTLFDYFRTGRIADEKAKAEMNERYGGTTPVSAPDSSDRSQCFPRC